MEGHQPRIRGAVDPKRRAGIAAVRREVFKVPSAARAECPEAGERRTSAPHPHSILLPGRSVGPCNTAEAGRDLACCATGSCAGKFLPGLQALPCPGVCIFWKASWHPGPRGAKALRRLACSQVSHKLWGGGGLTTARFGGQQPPVPWDGCQASTPPYPEAGLCSHKGAREAHPEHSVGGPGSGPPTHPLRDLESVTPAGLCSFPATPGWLGQAGRGA